MTTTPPVRHASLTPTTHLLLVIPFVVIFLWAGCVVPPDREPQDIYPYLQMPTATSMTIQWRTCAETSGTVRYGLTPAMELEAVESPLASRHAVTLTGLEPGSEYHYQVTADGEPLSEVHTFRTAPGEAAPFVFTVLGDTLYSPVEKLLIKDLIRADDPAFLLHIGDMTGEMGGYQESVWREHFFDDYADLLCLTPVLPVLGNHEYQGLVVVWFPISGGTELFRDYFTLPNNERWYSFDWGRCHFIGLDVNLVEELGGAQQDWLVADLERATDGVDDPEWIFAYWHQPAYSSGLGQTDVMGDPIRRRYVPLMETYGVDVVFYGHDHFYERSVKEGVTYIVTGGGGASPFPIIPGSNPYSRVAHHAYQYMRVSVTYDSALVESVNESGMVIDSFLVE